MSMSDPIADMLTRIRNAVSARKAEVIVKASNVNEGIAAVLKSEGFINGFDRIDDGTQGVIRIKLKYSDEGAAVINEIIRVSKPGRRVYSSATDLPKILGGMGISILSTSKGVMSDVSCRKNSAGGEVICTVS
ncbi:MAG: 30S ribosomal protein S8 [Phycisphaerae bacterium]|jgi:small subunit ribosomal protein S8